jgi:hypothetical protein
MDRTGRQINCTSLVITDFLKQRGPGHSDVAIDEPRAAIAATKMRHEWDIYHVERQLTGSRSGEVIDSGTAALGHEAEPGEPGADEQEKAAGSIDR